MKLLKSVNLIVLCLLLVSCGPAELSQADPTPVVTEAPEDEIIVPKAWPGIKDEWTFFKSFDYFSSYAYDPAGYLWLSSGIGIFRLNLETGRYEFLGKPKNYGSGNFITYFEDTIWMVSSPNHIAHFENGRWLEQEVAAGYAQQFINVGSRLWYIGSDATLYLEGEEWKTFSFPEEYATGFRNIAQAGDGTLWFFNYEMTVQYDGVNWIEHESLLGVNRMFSLATGEVLFSYDNLIIMYKDRKIVPLTLPDGRFRYPINSNLLLAPDGNYWFQTYSYGGQDDKETFLVSSAGIEQIPSVAFKDSPPDLYSPSLMTPKGWIFLSKNIVYLYDGEDWREYSLDKKMLTDMALLRSPIGFSPDGTLWFSQGDRPVSYDGEEIKDPFEEKHCQQYYDLARISPDGKDIWLGSTYRNYLCLFDLESETYYEGELPFNANGMDIAPDGNVWVSSRQGFIAKITPFILRKGDYRLIEPIKVGGENITTILKPTRILVDSQGSIWVYVKGYGVYRYKDGEWKNFGMANIDQNSLAVDSNGDVWVGKPGKLFKHENGTWVEFPQACICPTNLTVTRDDVLWFVNGCNGVYMYNERIWTQFTAEDIGGFTPSMILSAPDGAVWFFDYSHWTRYKPEE